MLIAYVLKSMKTYLERKAAEAKLLEMSDRDLKDIGVSRPDIATAVRFGR